MIKVSIVDDVSLEASSFWVFPTSTMEFSSDEFGKNGAIQDYPFFTITYHQRSKKTMRLIFFTSLSLHSSVLFENEWKKKIVWLFTSTVCEKFQYISFILDFTLVQVNVDDQDKPFCVAFFSLFGIVTMTAKGNTIIFNLVREKFQLFMSNGETHSFVCNLMMNH